MVVAEMGREVEGSVVALVLLVVVHVMVVAVVVNTPLTLQCQVAPQTCVVVVVEVAVQ